MTELNDLKTGTRVRGLVAAADVTIIAVEPHRDGIVSGVDRGDEGQISDRLLTAEQAAGSSIGLGRRWTGDADCVSVRLADTPNASVGFHNTFVPGRWCSGSW